MLETAEMLDALNPQNPRETYRTYALKVPGKFYMFNMFKVFVFGALLLAREKSFNVSAVGSIFASHS